jgi:hypothetical protein
MWRWTKDKHIHKFSLLQPSHHEFYIHNSDNFWASFNPQHKTSDNQGCTTTSNAKFGTLYLFAEMEFDCNLQLSIYKYCNTKLKISCTESEVWRGLDPEPLHHTDPSGSAVSPTSTDALSSACTPSQLQEGAQGVVRGTQMNSGVQTAPSLAQKHWEMWVYVEVQL